MNKVLEEFSKIGIIPVIALDNVEDAAPLAKALCDGGLHIGYGRNRAGYVME